MWNDLSLQECAELGASPKTTTSSMYILCSVFSCILWDDELTLERRRWPKVYMCQSKLLTRPLTFPLLVHSLQ